MSYGVVASRSVSVMVETTSALGGSDGDLVLDRFQSAWGAGWVPGRLTLTRLHVSVLPRGAGRGVPTIDLHLRDIEQVERSAGRMTRTLALRTSAHVVHVRSLGSAGLAHEVAELAAAARSLPVRRR
jgi:hypothetical protein